MAILNWLELLASTVLADDLVITHLMPFVTRGGSSERRIKIDAPT